MSDVQYFLYIHQMAVIAGLTTIGFAGLMIDLAFRSEKHDLGKIGKNLQVAGKIGEYVFVVSMVVCALSVIATPGKSFPKEHLHQETIPVAKVSLISGSDNYLIQGTNGKKYNVDEGAVTINTSNRSSAKFKRYVKPAVGTKQRKLYDKAIENGDIPESKLTMSLTAKDYNKHAIVWNFK